MTERHILRTEGLVWAKLEGNTIIINHEDFDELIMQEYKEGADVFDEFVAIIEGINDSKGFFLT